MTKDLKTVLSTIANVETAQLIRRKMRIEFMQTIVNVDDQWVQAQVQRRHHIRCKNSIMSAPVFSKRTAEQTIRFIGGSPTQAQKNQLTKVDKRLRLKEKQYELKMANVS